VAGSHSSKSVLAKAKKIHVLLMDVDGVLTDGRVWLASWPDGTAHEIKGFDAYDGQGLMLAHAMGLRTGVITGRESPAVARRAKELGLEFVYQGQASKTAAFEEILAKSGARAEEVCYVADDLPDLPVLRRVGLAVAVGNAAPEVKEAAHYVTKHGGGGGAVREVVELILKAQGKWAQAIREAHA
jgi:3-deoxy-D-manno-octulosonate 8-phosphate phosphatase (KDO 8-P phosphatase)